MLVTEGFCAFLIPDDARDKYFQLKEDLDAAARTHVDNSGWDAYNDPIVIIHDITVFSEHNQKAIRANMARIGAKDITDIYKN